MGFKKVYIQIMCILLLAVIAFSVYTVMNREEKLPMALPTENQNEIGMGTEELPLDTETEGTESTDVGNSETEQTSETEDMPPVDEPTRVLYANATVRVRSGAGTTFEVLGSLVRGAEVTAIGEVVDGWQKILYNGQEAYVMAEYLSETAPQDEPSRPNPPTPPDEPDTPDEPDEPDTPDEPDIPDDPVDPEVPEDPVIPDDPVEPEV